MYIIYLFIFKCDKFVNRFVDNILSHYLVSSIYIFCLHALFNINVSTRIIENNPFRKYNVSTDQR